MIEIMINYIYLLREREFIKTKEHVYKVGMTKKENHERFNQYPKGSVLLFQMICNNCKNMEKLVVKKFKETFKQRKDIGNEYFEGEYKNMIDIIYSTIKNENEIVIGEDDDEYVVEENAEEDIVEKEYVEEDWKMVVKSKKYQENAFKIVCNKINNIFPDHQQDLSFGGTKKFIKINLIDNQYFVYYINPQLKSLIYSEDGDTYMGKDFYDNLTEEELIYKDYNIICEDSIKFAWNEEKNYFNLLVNEQIIIPNKIYDLQSKGFIKKLSTNKMKINIDNYADFINTHNILIDENIYNKIYRILCYNLVINEKIYASIDTDVFEKAKKIKDFDNICIDIGMMLDNRNITNGKLITLHKINKKYYDYKTFLRKYIPYVIRWDINNNYYIVNRDYEYIGLNSKSIDYTKGGEAHLFNDGNKPWDNRNYYIRFCNEYKKIVNDNSLKECLNMHNSVKTILTLLD
jgi:hypothetical protein